MSEYLDLLMKDNNLRTSIGDAAKSNYKQLYTITQMVNCHEKLYIDLTKR